MPSIGSFPGEKSPAGGVSLTCSPVSGVNAHLRLIPRNPGDFRVVVTFHRADGSLCEAELRPVEAAGLMSEIARIVDQGSSLGIHTASGEKREVHDD